MPQNPQVALEQSVGDMKSAMLHWQAADAAYTAIARVQEGDKSVEAPIVKWTIRGTDGKPTEAVLDLARLDKESHDTMLTIMGNYYTDIYTRRLAEMAKYSGQADNLLSNLQLEVTDDVDEEEYEDEEYDED